VKLKILKSANQDLLNGYRFYECQEEGLGIYFMDSLFSDIDSLLIFAGIHPVFFGKYNRMLSKRFPFAVYYRINDDIISIHAVLDCRRNPAWTRNRLKSKP